MKRAVSVLCTCLFLMFCVSTLSWAAYDFFDGKQWKKIDGKPYPAELKKELKALLLKTAHGTSAFNGQPILSKTESDYASYIGDMDRFYSDPKNQIFPVNFALKIVSMHRQGIPEAQIKIYKIAIEKKLAKI